jgi:hypothetical protein
MELGYPDARCPTPRLNSTSCSRGSWKPKSSSSSTLPSSTLLPHDKAVAASRAPVLRFFWRITASPCSQEIGPLGATNAVEHNEPAHHPTHRKPTTGGGFLVGTRVGGVSRRSRPCARPRCSAESRRVGGDETATRPMGGRQVADAGAMSRPARSCIEVLSAECRVQQWSRWVSPCLEPTDTSEVAPRQSPART